MFDPDDDLQATPRSIKIDQKLLREQDANVSTVCISEKGEAQVTLLVTGRTLVFTEALQHRPKLSRDTLAAIGLTVVQNARIRA